MSDPPNTGMRWVGLMKGEPTVNGVRKRTDFFFLFQKINDKVQQDNFPFIRIKIQISKNYLVSELGNCALCLWLLLLYIVFLVTIMI